MRPMNWSKPPIAMVCRSEGNTPIPLDYVRKHQTMSAKANLIDLLWQGKKMFAFTVNEHVFNPSDSIVGHKLVDLVLSEKIDVAQKDVIDLGCGSGVVGLCAILRKAKKVLFTDINSHTDGIQKHPFFRKTDQWQVQDVLVDVPDSSYDLVLVLPPWMMVEDGRQIASDTFESGIFRTANLYHRILTESGRVLRAGGKLVVWLRIPIVGFDSLLQLLSTAAERFDLTSMPLLAHGIESAIYLDHEKSMMNRWLYKIQKGGVQNDALWMLLSLKKR